MDKKKNTWEDLLKQGKIKPISEKKRRANQKRSLERLHDGSSAEHSRLPAPNLVAMEGFDHKVNCHPDFVEAWQKLGYTLIQ